MFRLWEFRQALRLQVKNFQNETLRRISASVMSIVTESFYFKHTN